MTSEIKHILPLLPQRVQERLDQKSARDREQWFNEVAPRLCRAQGLNAVGTFYSDRINIRIQTDEEITQLFIQVIERKVLDGKQETCLHTWDSTNKEEKRSSRDSIFFSASTESLLLHIINYPEAIIEKEPAPKPLPVDDSENEQVPPQTFMQQITTFIKDAFNALFNWITYCFGYGDDADIELPPLGTELPPLGTELPPLGTALPPLGNEELPFSNEV